MNALQSIQSARGLAQVVDLVARKRPVAEVVGQVAGLAFAVQAGGVGSAASGLVADAVEGAIDGAGSTLNAASRLGGAAAAYVSQGAARLGRWVDVLV